MYKAFRKKILEAQLNVLLRTHEIFFLRYSLTKYLRLVQQQIISLSKTYLVNEVMNHHLTTSDVSSSIIILKTIPHDVQRQINDLPLYLNKLLVYKNVSLYTKKYQKKYTQKQKIAFNSIIKYCHQMHGLNINIDNDFCFPRFLVFIHV